MQYYPLKIKEKIVHLNLQKGTKYIFILSINIA